MRRRAGPIATTLAVLARRRTVQEHAPSVAASAAASPAGSSVTAGGPDAPAGSPADPSRATEGPIPPVRPLPPMRELVPPVDLSLLDGTDGPAGPRVVPGEEGVPRWLRPSVREARFAGDRTTRRSSWG
jgi:hypothetical protein